jgi:penicillin-binding protein 1C
MMQKQKNIPDNYRNRTKHSYDFNNMTMRRLNTLIIFSLIIFSIFFFLWLCYPMATPFPQDYSRLVYDCTGSLLRATLADDQQFRFPPDTISLPEKYVKCIIACEDRRFYNHLGVDPLALFKSIYTNFKAGRIIRGASTIPMQVARLAQPKSRTYLNKIYECFYALRLSLHYSKEEILRLYADHVPVGGNVVGIRAASYRYFGKAVGDITWAEASLLTVLPNTPTKINLQKERAKLLSKRNKLLYKLYSEHVIDSVTCLLASQEPLPHSPLPLPFDAPHFTQYVLERYRFQDIIRTSLDKYLQNRVLEAVQMHHAMLSWYQIRNLAVMVVETQTGKIKAYVGSQNFQDSLYDGQVDGIQAYRSTGSLLKPFLTAKVLDRGPYTIASMIQDVPTYYGTFSPQNVSKGFSGLVSLKTMLIQSLNVPFVRLLNTYGVNDFYDFLKQGGLKGLFRPAEEYGLSLIIGGAEASLFELMQLYLCLANYGQFKTLSPLYNDQKTELRENSHELFSAGAAWQVLQILTHLSRPGTEHYWQFFDNQIPVAWKTGTSYGQKDGWAIGVNRQWTIGVWVGNFDGQGNAEISGAKSAAPLLFTLFNMLTTGNRCICFEKPEYDLKEVVCCKKSGYPAGPYCDETVTIECPRTSYIPGICPFHRKYLVDKKSGRSVCSLCWSGIETKWVNRYIVPPSVKEILIRSGVAVDSIPKHAAHCVSYKEDNRLEIVYPVNGIKIFIPRDFDGNYEKIVLTAKHNQPATHLFWYINGALIGKTLYHHQLPITLNPGKYKLTIQDEEGFTKSVSFRTYKKDS